MTGLFAALTDGQKAAALAYCGEDSPIGAPVEPEHIDVEDAIEAGLIGIAPEPPPKTRSQLRTESKRKGYEGSACPDCGNFTMVRNGTCLKCETCGSTTGCS